MSEMEQDYYTLKQIQTYTTLGNSLRTEGIANLEHVALGEERAKEALYVGLLMRRAIGLFGAPGGSKTNLAKYFPLTIDGIDLNNIAELPPHSAATALQYVGGETSYDKVILGPNREPLERSQTSSTANAIVKPNSQGLWGDELPRQNQEAVNGLLPVLEEGVLKTTAGTVELPKLEYAIFGSNPSERRHVSQPLAVAMAARIAVGALLGLRTGQEYKNNMEKLASEEGWAFKPWLVSPVINLKDLHVLQGFTQSRKLQPRVAELVAHGTDRLLDGLEEANTSAEEAWGRPTVLVREATKALGVLRNDNGIATEQEVYDALLLRGTAILSSLAINVSSRKINEEVTSIVNAI